MPNTISRAVIATSALIATCGTAFAQLTTAPKSTGPSGSEFIADISTWLANHQGAAIAIGACLVLVVGMIVWNRINKPSADAGKK